VRYVVIFFLTIGVGFGVLYYRETSICRKPLAYDVGDFDMGFGIKKDKFITTIKEAEAVWEKGLGQDLFNYQAGAKFKINLIFDERQKITLEGEESKGEIEESRASYNALLSQYKALEASYKLDLARYEAQLATFEQRLASYNARVAEMNARGGATPKEYQELEKERQYLESLRAELDKERASLNYTASRLNALGDEVNNMAQRLNIEVDVHNQVFGEAREFDQGEYTNGKINIYQFDAISDLRLVLAHELGHALGLEHVENPKSIMYYLMEKQNLQNIALTAEDIAAFRSHCEFHILPISFKSLGFN